MCPLLNTVSYHRALDALGRARVRHHLRPVPPVQPAVGRSGASHRRQPATGGRCSGSAASGVHGATGAGHVCVPRGSAFAGPSYLLHRGPSLSPTVHRPALRGASRWFLPRSACPNNSAWARMVTGPTGARPPLTSTGAELLLLLVLRMLVVLLLLMLLVMFCPLALLQQ